MFCFFLLYFLYCVFIAMNIVLNITFNANHNQHFIMVYFTETGIVQAQTGYSNLLALSTKQMVLQTRSSGRCLYETRHHTTQQYRNDTYKKMTGIYTNYASKTVVVWAKLQIVVVWCCGYRTPRGVQFLDTWRRIPARWPSGSRWSGSPGCARRPGPCARRTGTAPRWDGEWALLQGGGYGTLRILYCNVSFKMSPKV